MASGARVHDEPAFVLHRHDWSESSLVLDVFARHHGRLVLVAKGVKRPSSQFRPVLLPLQPLRLGWGGDGEVRTLKAAQWQGGHVMPTGDALLSGCYLNELLLRLLARDDAHPALFDHYADAVRGLALALAPAAAVLRAFELLLLREAGFLPDLGHEGASLSALHPDHAYALAPEGGLRRVAPSSQADQAHLAGAQWQTLARALEAAAPTPALWAVCADAALAAALRPQLRTLLLYHSGVRVFQTRQLLLDLQRLLSPEPA